MVNNTNQDEFEVVADGKTVWVNSLTGMCIARFTPRAVDIHHDSEKQMAGEHCLDCFAYPPNERSQAWEKFKQGMKAHYALDIPEWATPTNLSPSYQ